MKQRRLRHRMNLQQRRRKQIRIPLKASRKMRKQLKSLQLIKRTERKLRLRLAHQRGNQVDHQSQRPPKSSTRIELIINDFDSFLNLPCFDCTPLCEPEMSRNGKLLLVSITRMVEYSYSTDNRHQQPPLDSDAPHLKLYGSGSLKWTTIHESCTHEMMTYQLKSRQPVGRMSMQLRTIARILFFLYSLPGCEGIYTGASSCVTERKAQNRTSRSDQIAIVSFTTFVWV